MLRKGARGAEGEFDQEEKRGGGGGGEGLGKCEGTMEMCRRRGK